MPQIIIKGVALDQIRAISTDLVERLSLVSNTPKDYFLLECVQSTFVFNGELAKPYPLIEVKWFDRGDQCKLAFATSITQAIRSLGYPDVEVYFTTLSPVDYFENGVPLG